MDSPASGAEARAETGVGSVASFGPRFLAFLIDGVIADVISAVINGGVHANGAGNSVPLIAFLAIELVFVSLAGQTPGMRIIGIGVARADGRGRAMPWWVLVRTILLATIIPAIITDSSGRAMHDRAAGTIMLHTR